MSSIYARDAVTRQIEFCESELDLSHLKSLSKQLKIPCVSFIGRCFNELMHS